MPQITMINQTADNFNVALFKETYTPPYSTAVAWKVETPRPEGGKTETTIPTDYQVYITYSENPVERENPDAGQKTTPITIAGATGNFAVNEKRPALLQTPGAILKCVFTPVTENEIHIENQAPFGVWFHVLLDGIRIHSPHFIQPGGTVILKDEESRWFAAVVKGPVAGGDLVPEEKLTGPPVEALTG
ncbi:MAG: hypothetical protein GY950_00675, partial [bacterium]|nr:hypothetical protein [bacterium]